MTDDASLIDYSDDDFYLSEESEYEHDTYDYDRSSPKRGRNLSCVDENFQYYQLIHTEELYNLMQGIITETEEIIKLPRTYLRLCLTKFNWNKAHLVEAYWDSSSEKLLSMLSLPKELLRSFGETSNSQTAMNSLHHTENSQRKCYSKILRSSVAVTYECSICCMETNDANDMLHAGCAHVFCFSCWIHYLKTKIEENISNRIICPAYDCNRIVFDEWIIDLCQRHSEEITIKRYKKLVAITFVCCNPELTWCPGPNCVYAARVKDINTTTNSSDCYSSLFTDPHLYIKCKCNEEFCHKCGYSWHEPLPCKLLTKWMKKTQDDSETCNWISANTKDCPKCKALIEKDGGCNHMICKNLTCRYEFCWVCLGAWEPHGSSWYNCNKFYNDDAVKARDFQEKSRAAILRFLFYFNRYANHKHSLKLEHKLHGVVEKKMEDMQSQNLSWIDVQFLKTAVNTLFLCRRTLMYTYVFAFYLEADNQVHIFEGNQRDLETSTEELSGFLERENSSEDLDVQRKNVHDKIRYCEGRRQALLKHVMEGYENNTWCHNIPL